MADSRGINTKHYTAVRLPVEKAKSYANPAVPFGPKPVYNAVKRAIDFFASLCALLLIFPVMVIIGICIKLNSKGPVLFKQERLGLGGRPFIMYKFRSMYEDAEKEGAMWAQKDDPRVTRVGAVLRRTRLDELPQLVNIIKGDLSIVGPRPERAIFYDEFKRFIPYFHTRLTVVPGLTGWAQVNGGYDLGPCEKIVFDLEYITNRSLWMDFRCVMKTVGTIFTHDGAR